MSEEVIWVHGLGFLYLVVAFISIAMALSIRSSANTSPDRCTSLLIGSMLIGLASYLSALFTTLAGIFSSAEGIERLVAVHLTASSWFWVGVNTLLLGGAGVGLVSYAITSDAPFFSNETQGRLATLRRFIQDVSLPVFMLFAFIVIVCALMTLGFIFYLS